MPRLESFADKRILANCIFCGGETTSSEHVPSKIFLDKPYPENHPTIFICKRCNHGFSLDEQYVACLIECARIGSTDPNELDRTNIKNTLRKRPSLAARIQQAFVITGKSAYVSIEEGRVRNVIMKIAKGHAAYELEEPTWEEPISFTVKPLMDMEPNVRENFESPPLPRIFPEVGSRAMQRTVICSGQDNFIWNGWIELQPGRYRYLASVDEGVLVRMVFSEYLACEVRWR